MQAFFSSRLEYIEVLYVHNHEIVIFRDYYQYPISRTFSLILTILVYWLFEAKVNKYLLQRCDNKNVYISKFPIGQKNSMIKKEMLARSWISADRHCMESD